MGIWFWVFFTIYFSLTLLFLIRNIWVYKVRTDLKNSNINLYNRLPTQSTMIYRVWVWDVVKFIDYGTSHMVFDEQQKERSKQRGDKITDRYLKSKDPS